MELFKETPNLEQDIRSTILKFNFKIGVVLPTIDFAIFLPPNNSTKYQGKMINDLVSAKYSPL